MNLKFDRVASVVFLVLGILIIVESQKFLQVRTALKLARVHFRLD